MSSAYVGVEACGQSASTWGGRVHWAIRLWSAGMGRRNTWWRAIGSGCGSNGAAAVRQELERLAAQYRRDERLTWLCWCAPLPCHADVVREAVLA